MKSNFAILIVNWNSCKDVVRAIRQIPDSIDIVIIDNNSPDLDALKTALLEERPVNLLESTENGGYGAGMNIGIKFAEENLSSRSLLLLNPDAHITDEFLRQVEKVEGSADVMGFQQFSLDTSGRAHFYPCAARYRNWKITIDPPEVSGTREVDIVTGAALLIRAESLKSVGYFDESFFHYKEEFDLCFRMKLAGMKVAINFDIPLQHSAGSSLAHGSTNAIYYQIRNEILYSNKYREMPALRRFLNCASVVRSCFKYNPPQKFKTIASAVFAGLLGKQGIRRAQ
jgi:GT2 family glycosyltransferase